MTALAQLSPRMRHAIIDTLRWRSLRPVQEDSIPVVLGGHNAVILAPTAGGKTEAAFLPALDVLSRERGRGCGCCTSAPSWRCSTTKRIARGSSRPWSGWRPSSGTGG